MFWQNFFQTYSATIKGTLIQKEQKYDSGMISTAPFMYKNNTEFTKIRQMYLPHYKIVTRWRVITIYHYIVIM